MQLISPTRLLGKIFKNKYTSKFYKIVAVMQDTCLPDCGMKMLYISLDKRLNQKRQWIGSTSFQKAVAEKHLALISER